MGIPERAQLRIEDLRQALNQVLDQATDRFGPTVDLGQAGQYWHLPWDVAYAFDDDAGLRVDIGDTLEDDMAELRDVLQVGTTEERVLSTALASLAELLRWLAFQDAPRERNQRRPDVSDDDVLRLLRQQWRIRG